MISNAFLDSVKVERESQLAKVKTITEQIKQLQAEKDLALAIASRLEELIQFYGEEASPAILVPSQEVVEEVEQNEEVKEFKVVRKPSSHAQYVNLLKREFKKIPITKNIIAFLESHPDETIHVDVIAKHLGRENLSKKDWDKLKLSVNNALHKAVTSGYCFRVVNGVYTLKENTYKRFKEEKYERLTEALAER